jgi:hypothetical protein
MSGTDYVATIREVPVEPSEPRGDTDEIEDSGNRRRQEDHHVLSIFSAAVVIHCVDNHEF